MKAMIFAAGLGTRLRPLTDHCPKAMIEIGGDAMLGRVLRRAIEAGVSEAVVNVHHLPQMIVDYLDRNDNFGITIHISHEDNLLLDTGGGLLAARKWLDGDDDILLHNADIFTDVDIRAMLKAHQKTSSAATLLAWHRESSRALLVDNEGRMRGWTNTVTGQVLPSGADTPSPDFSKLDKVAFGGVHIVSPRIFPELERYRAAHGDVFSITPFYIDSCSSLPINIYSPSGPIEWADMGKPETVERLRNQYH